MNELKTFDEIFDGNSPDGVSAVYEYTKQEAIKWIKVLQDIHDNENQGNFNFEKYKLFGSFSSTHQIRFVGDISDYQGTIRWIKHFFNIKEDDLK